MEEEYAGWVGAAHRARFSRPGLNGGIIAGLERLHKSDLVRVSSLLATGELEVGYLGYLCEQEAIELGSTIGRPALTMGVHVFTEEEDCDVLRYRIVNRPPDAGRRPRRCGAGVCAGVAVPLRRASEGTRRVRR
jgi:hypothetical protein